MAQESPLTELPPELRNMIYGLALISKDGPIDVSSVTHPNEPALLATCKQIRSEALPIFYSENGFRYLRMDPSDSYQSTLHEPSQWLKTLGETRCALVEDFRVELGVIMKSNTALKFPEHGDTVLRMIKTVPELQEELQKMKKIAEEHIVATQALGVRLSALQFTAPDRMGSCRDVFKKLFQEGGEHALNECRAMKQV